MPTEVYKTGYVKTIDGLEIEIIPIKIKYLKQLMVAFDEVQKSTNEEQTINILTECSRIAMKQYYPKLSKSIADMEDNFDLNAIYDILYYSAGIDIKKNSDQPVVDQAKKEENEANWNNLDLAKLETEVFLLGIWKNFDELESSISIEELMQILSVTRDLDYEEKKFSAALQGIDLDASSGKSDEKVRGQKEWEDLKARVFSGGATDDSNDVLALQGQNARKAGFGIGMGLAYEDLRDPKVLKTK
jgi:type 1 fimbria pilin